MSKQQRSFFIRKISLLLLLCTFVFAQNITLSFIKSKPKSIARDYYIWRYLKENDLNTSTALWLMGQMKSLNMRRFVLFAKKIDKPSYQKAVKCYKMKPKEFINSDADCVEIGLSPYDATKLDKKELLKIKNIVEDKYPKKAQMLDIFLSDLPFKELIYSDKDIFFKVFNSVGSKYRNAKFNQYIEKIYLNRYINDYRFNQTIKLIVTNPKLKPLQLSLLDINSSNLNANSNFFLFLNALQYKQNKPALRYLKLADKKYYYRFDKDKVLFWRYLVTKDKKYLEKLAKSFDKNIYSLYALEELKKEPKNLKTALKCKEIKSGINISDPFSWLNILNKLNKKDTNVSKVAQQFKSCKELPYKAFALERANYRNSYFIVPYKKYIDKYSINDQALILAIARQESRFIPSSISSSYALGMMQFMPFLARATAKVNKMKNFDLDDIFQPKVAYKFAYEHIKYLEKKLKHPLLMAYAYNGGIGFTKRMLKNGLFKRGVYEPFLSIELVTYNESKRYAKKVLANYVIYKQILGEKVSIKALFQSLVMLSCH